MRAGVRVAITAGPGTHSAYRELLDAPPPGVVYESHPLEWGSPLWPSRLQNWAAWKVRAARRLLVGQPDAFKVPDWGLPIHSAQALLDTHEPWVVDFEYPTFFTGFDAKRLALPRIQRRIKKRAKPCRAFLPWTEACAQATRAMVPDIAPKLRVVRPAIQARVAADPDPAAPLVLFVARFFARKGGLEALEAFTRVRRTVAPTARMRLLSTAPVDVQERYRGQGIEFLPAGQPREHVLAHYREASVFILPTRMDSFGMVILEAMAHGVPPLVSDTFAVDEIVKDGVDGVVVPGYREKWFAEDHTPAKGNPGWEDLRSRTTPAEREEVIARFEVALAKLLTDEAYRRRIAANAYRTVVAGRHSVDRRNKELLEVYANAFA